MRRIWIFILFLAFICQLSAVSGQQTSLSVPEPVEGTTSGASTSSATAAPKFKEEEKSQSSLPMAHGSELVDSLSCSLVDYHINQINLADSLYKNYLPQYNFEEVKAAVEFFDSVHPSAVSY